MDQSSPSQTVVAACELSAIPAAERPRHVALVRSLFGDESHVRELTDGLETLVAADRFADVTTFIENERRCCPHLAFALEVPAANGPLTVRVTGPGAADELRALSG